MRDADARLAADLSLAVIRLARQLRFRRPDSPVSLSQLSALSTRANKGPMTPGALAMRERVRPAHPVEFRQVLVSASRAGTAGLMSGIVDETA